MATPRTIAWQRAREAELLRLRTFAAEIRDLMQTPSRTVSAAWMWRTPLDGADVIEEVTAALVRAGYDAADDDDGYSDADGEGQ